MLDGLNGDPFCFSETGPATETDVFTEADLARERHEYTSQFGRDQGLALFEQEYMCSFEAAVLGWLYVEELRLARESGRIGKIPVDRIRPSRPPGTSATTRPPRSALNPTKSIFRPDASLSTHLLLADQPKCGD
jgi:hypothetical protein